MIQIIQNVKSANTQDQARLIEICSEGRGTRPSFSFCLRSQIFFIQPSNILYTKHLNSKITLFMKQEVVNYEYDIIQQQTTTSSLFPSHDPRNFRYCTWDLHEIVERIAEKKSYNIKWIGNSSNANILAFFYCVLVGSLNQNGEDGETFVKLKYSLYQISKEWLTVSEQKTFVEHLCLVEYSKSVTEFLKKSNHLQTILIKIFCSHRREMRTKNRKKIEQSQNLSKLEELKSYSILFPFICYEVEDERVAKLTINGVVFHIVEEKQCFFVVEYNKINDSLDSVKARKKQTEIDHPAQLQTKKKKYKKKNQKLFEIVQEQREQEDYKQLLKPKLILENNMVSSVSSVGAHVAVSSRKNLSKFSEESEPEKQHRSQIVSMEKKIFKKESPNSKHPIRMNNVSSEHSIRESVQNYNIIRASIGQNNRRNDKMLQSKKSPLKQSSKSPKIYNQQMKQSQQKLIPTNPQNIKARRHMEVSLNSDENNVEVEKKGKSKSRKKVPKFLQKKKECLLPMDSKLSREKSPTEKNRSIRQKSPIVPISPYPMINFQIASPGRK